MPRLPVPGIQKRIRYEGYGLHMGGQTSAGVGVGIETVEMQSFVNGAKDSWPSLTAGTSASQARLASRTHALCVNVRAESPVASTKFAFANRAVTTFAAFTSGEDNTRMGAAVSELLGYFSGATDSSTGLKHVFATDATSSVASLAPVTNHGSSTVQTEARALFIGGGNNSGNVAFNTNELRFASDTTLTVSMLGDVRPQSQGACGSFAGMGLVVTPYSTSFSVLDRVLSTKVETLIQAPATGLSSLTARNEGGAIANPRGMYATGNVSAVATTTSFKLENNLAAIAGATLTTGRRNLGGVLPSSNQGWIPQDFQVRGPQDAANANGNIFNVSGNNSGVVAGSEKATLATLARASSTSLATARFAPTTLQSPNGIAWLVGGIGTAATNLSSVEKFVCSTEAVSTEAATLNSQAGAGSASAANGYVLGGSVSNGSAIQTVNRFPWATTAFASLGNVLGTAVRYHGSVGTSDYVFTMGGINSGGTTISSTQVFGHGSETATAASNLVSARNSSGRGACSGPIGVLGFGIDAGGSYQNQVVVFGLGALSGGAPSQLATFSGASNAVDAQSGGCHEFGLTSGGYSAGLAAITQSTTTDFESKASSLANSALSTARAGHSSFSSYPGEFVKRLTVPVYVPVQGRNVYSGGYSGNSGAPYTASLEYRAASGILATQTSLGLNEYAAASCADHASGYVFGGESTAGSGQRFGTRIDHETGASARYSNVLGTGRRYARAMSNGVEAAIASGLDGGNLATWDIVALSNLASAGSISLTVQNAASVLESATDGYLIGGASADIVNANGLTTNSKYRFNTRATNSAGALATARVGAWHLSYETFGSVLSGFNTAGTAVSSSEKLSFSGDTFSAGNALTAAGQKAHGASGAANNAQGLGVGNADGRVSVHAAGTDTWIDLSGGVPQPVDYGTGYSTSQARLVIANVQPLAGVNAGYTFGGAVDSVNVIGNATSSVYKFTDASSTWTTSTGVLAASGGAEVRFAVAAFGNNVQGFQVGGQAPAGVYSTNSQRLSYASEGLSSRGSDLGAARAYSGTLSHHEHALHLAGSNGSATNTTSKFAHPTQTQEVSSTWATSLFFLGTASFREYGYSLGGVNGSSAVVAEGIRWTWATNVCASQGSKLATSRSSSGGQGMQSNTHAYAVGGGQGTFPQSTRITNREKFALATETSTSLSALVTARSSTGAFSMPGRGLLLGGLSGAGTGTSASDVVGTVDATDFSNDAQSTTTSMAVDLWGTTGLSARVLF